jgi:hypothetical protein
MQLPDGRVMTVEEYYNEFLKHDVATPPSGQSPAGLKRGATPPPPHTGKSMADFATIRTDSSGNVWFVQPDGSEISAEKYFGQGVGKSTPGRMMPARRQASFESYDGPTGAHHPSNAHALSHPSTPNTYAGRESIGKTGKKNEAVHLAINNAHAELV